MTIPYSLADITPSWLTEVLHAAGVLKSSSVKAFDVRQFGDGITGVVARVTLEYDEEEVGAPSSLIAKLGAQDADIRKMIFEEWKSYQREVSFFREMAHQVPVRIPRCYHADIQEDQNEVVLLLEDLAPAKTPNWESGCSEAQSELAIRSVAELHAKWWNHSDVDACTWLFRRPAEKAQKFQDDFGNMWQACIKRINRPVPDRISSLADRLGSFYTDAIARSKTPPQTIIHNDYKLDNLFFDNTAGGAPLTVIDWQLVGAGRGVSDVASFLTGSVTSGLRRSSERVLLRAYHDTLLRCGVDDYDFEACWDDYRLAVLLRLPRIAMVISRVTSLDENVFFNIFWPGCCQAILDLEADKMI